MRASNAIPLGRPLHLAVDAAKSVQTLKVVSTDPIYIVLEFCLGGELLDYVRKKGMGGIKVGRLVQMAFEAAQGMNYLHQKLCIHRDLAARNCLITGERVIKTVAPLHASSPPNEASLRLQARRLHGRLHGYRSLQGTRAARPASLKPNVATGSPPR